MSGAFGLLETMRRADGALPWWDAHLARLRASAQRLGWPVALPGDLRARAAALPEPVVRLVLWPDGQVALQGRAMEGPAVVRLIPVLAVRAGDAPPRDLKTTDRRHYDAALAEARAGGADDGVLLGPGGEVLETAVGNLWLLLDGVWVTPPADGRVLPGVMRGALLRGAGASVVTAERVCGLGDLHRATALAVSNAVHGVRPAALVGCSPAADCARLVRFAHALLAG